MEEKKETHPLESLYTTGAEGWSQEGRGRRPNTSPSVRSSIPPWSKIVKTQFCAWYRVELDNTLFKPAV